MLVSPVFKRGDRSDTANYRPISVGDSLEKLYATVLNARLVGWLKSNGLRAPALRQTLARLDLGLILAQSISSLPCGISSRTIGASTCAGCMLAFKSLISMKYFAETYHLVLRHLLWHVMRSIGVHEQFKFAFKQL